jgi:hypothetical protein
MKVKVVDENGKTQVVKKVVEEKSPNYIEIYATSIEGGPFGPYDFRLNFYEESIEKSNAGNVIVKRNHKAKVIVSYATAKQLVKWMEKHLDIYEKDSGHEIFVGNEIPKDTE